ADSSIAQQDAENLSVEFIEHGASLTTTFIVVPGRPLRLGFSAFYSYDPARSKWCPRCALSNFRGFVAGASAARGHRRKRSSAVPRQKTLVGSLCPCQSRTLDAARPFSCEKPSIESHQNLAEVKKDVEAGQGGG